MNTSSASETDDLILPTIVKKSEGKNENKLKKIKRDSSTGTEKSSESKVVERGIERVENALDIDGIILSGVDYATRVKTLKTLRNNIKQEKLALDEHLPNLGLDEVRALMNVKTEFNRCFAFHGKKGSLDLAIKCILVRTDFSSNDHPSMIEYLFLKEFSDNVLFTKLSPHIVGYLGAKKVKNDCKLLRNLNLKTLEVDHSIKQKVLLLFSEYMKGGSLDGFSKMRKKQGKELTTYEWKVVIFQMVYTMYVLQQRYNLMHNDLHYGNILIDTDAMSEDILEYKTLGKTFYVKNPGFTSNVWDLEYCEIYKPPSDMSVCFKNKLLPTLGINPILEYDEHYDIHFFISSLLELDITKEVRKWILEVFPKEVIPHEFLDEEFNRSSSSSNSVISVDIKAKMKEHEASIIYSDSDSYSSSYTDTTSDSYDSSSEGTEFICYGRLLQGVGERLGLVTPKTLLSDKFFDELLVKPNNLDKQSTIRFEY